MLSYTKRRAFFILFGTSARFAKAKNLEGEKNFLYLCAIVDKSEIFTKKKVRKWDVRK